MRSGVTLKAVTAHHQEHLAKGILVQRCRECKEMRIKRY